MMKSKFTMLLRNKIVLAVFGLVFTFFFAGVSHAQNDGTQPCKAINLVCKTTYHTDQSFSNYIDLPANIPGGCVKPGNTANRMYNLTFFWFRTYAPVDFQFKITPKSPGSDYDYWIADVTGININSYCNFADLYSNNPSIFACNTYTGTGVTGRSATAPVCPGVSQCAMERSTIFPMHHDYLLVVSNWNGGAVAQLPQDFNEGFTLDISASGNLFYNWSIGNGNACVGSPGTMSVENKFDRGDFQYQWTMPDGSTNWGNPIYYTPAAVGNYNFTVKVIPPAGGACVAQSSTMPLIAVAPFNYTATANKVRICAGESIVLSATGGPATADYVWSGPGIPTTVKGNNITVTPPASAASPLIYKVVGNVYNHPCKDIERTVQVIMDPSFDFSVSASGGVTQVCAGSGITLYTSGGPSNATYTWSGPGLSSTTGSYVYATPTTTPSTPFWATYTVTATVPGGVCPVTRTISLIIIPPSNFSFSLTATDTKICEGEYVTVTAVGAPAGSTFSWSITGHAPIVPPNPQSAVYTPYASNPLIEAWATAPGYTCPVKATILIAVDQPFPLTFSSNSPNVCSGGSTTLTANGLSSNTAFTWNGGNLNNAMGASQVVSPVTPTLYTVSAKDPANECTVTNQISVSVNEVPVVSISENCNTLCADVTPTILSPGDIAIIRYRTDPVDDFAFVPLVNLPAGMVISFTDKGWNGSAFINNTGDNTFTYTVPAAGLSAGAVVVLSSSQYSFDLSDQGDQIFVFQGTEAAPKFIYGLNSGVWQTTGTVTSTSSYLPSVFLKGYTATNYPYERDNGKYCPAPGSVNILSGTPTSILYKIGDQSKWLRSNTPTFYTGDEVGVNANWSFNVSPIYTPGYSWSTGASASCINSSTPGTYSVTYTDLHGCTASASKTAGLTSATPAWSTYFGSDFAVSDLKISPVTGNLLVCGSIQSANQTIPYTNGFTVRNYGNSSLPSRMVIAEVSKDGSQVLWVDYIAAGVSGLYRIDVDVNGEIYASYLNSDLPDYKMSAIKLDAQGYLQWIVTDLFNTQSYAGSSVTVTNDAVYLLFTATCGATYPATLTSCQGNTSIGVAKLSKTNGVILWTTFFGGPDNSYPRSLGYRIAHDPAGNIYFTGDAGAMPASYSTSLLPLVNTYTTTSPNTYGNPVIVKMDKAGTIQWWDMLSEAERGYCGIEVKNGHVYTTNFNYVSPGMTNSSQRFYRRDAATGSLQYSKGFTIDFTLQPYVSNPFLNRFEVFDFTIDNNENVYITGRTNFRSMNSISGGAGSYHSSITTPQGPSPVTLDFEIFIASYSGIDFTPKWYTYYGVDPTVTTRYSNTDVYQYVGYGITTDVDGAMYIGGYAVADYDDFQIVNPSSGVALEATNPAHVRKGYLTKFSCGGNGQARMASDNKSAELSIVYPNPFSTSTMLEVKGQSGELCDVIVYSMEGVEIFKRQNIAAGQSLEIGEGLLAGMYFVSIRGSQGTTTSVKIIKQ